MGHIEITNWWAFIFLPIPVFVHLYLPYYNRGLLRVKYPNFKNLSIDFTQVVQSSSFETRRVILGVIWSIVVIIMSNPILVSESETVYNNGRDVAFVVDLSDSMNTRDIKSEYGGIYSRLAASKDIIGKYVSSKSGDRFALVFFGGKSYLQSPFTSDKEAWLDMLNEATPGMAGNGTNIGDAIGLATKIFQNNNDDENNNKIAIILTDGNNTGGIISPNEAAKIAKLYNVIIHIVVVGDVSLSRSNSPVNMKLMKEISSESGGKVFRASSQDELINAYEMIDSIRSNSYAVKKRGMVTTIHQYLILVMFVMFIIFIKMKVKHHS